MFDFYSTTTNFMIQGPAGTPSASSSGMLVCCVDCLAISFFFFFLSRQSANDDSFVVNDVLTDTEEDKLEMDNR